MSSVGAIHFEDRFFATRKGGIRGGGGDHPKGYVVLAGCRKVLVSTGLAISLPFDTNGRSNQSSAYVGAPFMAL